MAEEFTEEIKEIIIFLEKFYQLLIDVGNCRKVLFDKKFRKPLKKALSEALDNLEKIKPLLHDANPEKMKGAGLTGVQLTLKLNSFSSSYDEFDQQGTKEALEEALGKGGILLQSLAGAIPGVGSLLAELVDFIKQELKKRLKIRK